ncbi:MAG: OmpA family protein [Bacteroidetes bacterium]|nr:OmpA family protein [Bacteroidota bacterium]
MCKLSRKGYLLRLLVFLTAFSHIAYTSEAQQKRNTNNTSTKVKQQQNTPAFDLNKIPISTKNLGFFPYFSLPADLEEQNIPVQRNFDRTYFAIAGKMIPVEGKIWKSNITPKSHRYADWSLPYFENSYDEAIKAAGGVKIFDGQISQEEYEKYHNQAIYLGEDGSIGYPDQNIKTYIIRRSDSADIYIQFTGTTSGGSINILQKKAFVQTIKMMKADEIKNDLVEKGKAILHINFDTDKATLKPDGKEAVKEIVKVLSENKELHIAINGYTDNSGSVAYNQKLSEERASTVKNEIIKSGISPDRLTSQGYGQDHPISDNTSEEGKAKNRRVELVKL